MIFADNQILTNHNNQRYPAFYFFSRLVVKEFIKTGLIHKNIGKVFNEAYELRVATDYQDFAVVTRLEVEEYLVRMKELVEVVDKILK